MRYEPKRWGPGPSILSSENLAALRAALELTPLIVEHWFYYGGRSPERRIFEYSEDLEAYLGAHAKPGDDIWVWRFDVLCQNDNTLTHGKVPDADGNVPAGGAY
jgi:hypothetical protein